MSGRISAVRAQLKSSQTQALLGVLFVISVLLLAFIMGPSDTVGPRTPNADWEWNTSDEEVVFSHDGGEPAPRAALYIVTVKNESFNQRISDLGTSNNPVIIEPFPDTTIRQGDAIVLNRDEIDGSVILLRWTNGDLDATLAEYKF